MFHCTEVVSVNAPTSFAAVGVTTKVNNLALVLVVAVPYHGSVQDRPEKPRPRRQSYLGRDASASWMLEIPG
eukprot:2669706-Prymnesium_polylepis.1